MAKKSIWISPEGDYLATELIKLRVTNLKLTMQELAEEFNALHGKEYGIEVTSRSVQAKLTAIKRKENQDKVKWASPGVSLYFAYLLSFFPDNDFEWFAQKLNETFPHIREEYGPFSSYQAKIRKGFLKDKGRLPNIGMETLRVVNKIERQRLESDETIKKIAEVERALIKARTELSWRKKKDKIVFENRNLKDLILEKIEETVTPFSPVKVPRAIVPRTTRKTKESVVLMLSDIHFGEKVSSKETYGLGGYNVETAVRRLQHLSDSVIRITQKQLRGYAFSKLYVFGLGDWVNGTIHEELAKTSELNVVEQSHSLAYVLSQMILEWSQVFPQVKTIVISGNHSRLYKKQPYKERYENWDYNTGLFLREMLRNQPNCQVEIPNSIIDYQEVENHVFALMHGDDIPASGSTQYTGIQKALFKLESIQGGKFRDVLRGIKREYRGLETRERGEKNAKIAEKLLRDIIDNGAKYLIDNVCMGHYHTVVTLQNGDILMNGSVIGSNEFSVANFLSGVPVQRLFGVHPERGKTWEFSLRLDVADKEHKRIRYKLPPELEEKGLIK